MSTLNRLTIVIPTFNRPNQLSDVLDSLFASDIRTFEDVEVVVVDDGSDLPARGIVENFIPRNPFRIAYIYQENAGPAEARNNGFRLAANEIVLFIDDDILVFPDLILKHVEAHREMPGSVICGQSPYAIPSEIDSEYEYLNSLHNEGFDSIGVQDGERFVGVEIVASGNISVEKHLFKNRSVYAPGLRMPIGEEYELSLYLKNANIPIYLAPQIKGWHLQPATIVDSCKQNYKYGLGIAELAIKRPDVLSLEQLRAIWETNRRLVADDPATLKLKKIVRRLFANRLARTILLWCASSSKAFVPSALLFVLYRLTVGSFLAAGILDGSKKFAKEKNEC
ncbi:MAG: glycosyltransferase family 2 protein [Pyrinomonadaceae bacterium]